MMLFGTVPQMPVGVTKMMDKSWAPVFRRLIFEKIEECRYAGLYSTVERHPKFPVNIWVGLGIIKWMFDYADQELLEQFHSHRTWMPRFVNGEEKSACRRQGNKTREYGINDAWG